MAGIARSPAPYRNRPAEPRLTASAWPELECRLELPMRGTGRARNGIANGRLLRQEPQPHTNTIGEKPGDDALDIRTAKKVKGAVMDVRQVKLVPAE